MLAIVRECNMLVHCTCCAITVKVGVVTVAVHLDGTIATVVVPNLCTPLVSWILLPPHTIVAMILYWASGLMVTLIKSALRVAATTTV